jgi:hypothetical protein
MTQEATFVTDGRIERPRISAGTRRAAYGAISTDAPNLRSRVYASIKRAGVNGMTAQELERELSLNGSTVRPRIVELRRAGHIRESGEVRQTLSGRHAAVWVAGVAGGLDSQDR